MAKAPSVPSREQMRVMIQQMLRERFALRTHRETREMPVYVLSMARADGRFGEKLTRTTVDCVRWLSPYLGRAVVDRTGLKGDFDVELAFSPGGNTGTPVDDTVSVYAALQEQLGLRVDPGNAAVEVLVIDSAQMPTPD